MAGRIWQPRDSKKFARQARLNTPYYVVMDVARRVAPYEDAQLYSEYVFTGKLPFTGSACTESGYSAEDICRLYGPVYEQKPAGLRNVAAPAPQVAGPLPKGYVGHLDEAEIRGLEKQVADMPDPKKRRFGR
ncbi:hypothetical protein ACIGXF_16625 [Streptomyces sp. NPDC053086]|uniref:hypothetical protein n=1 Tax=unclassified Streptomyces TaxID=2593676 RepID=UPI0037D0032B